LGLPALSVLVSAAAALAMGRGDLGDEYKYDIRQYQKTDPALILCQELEPMRPGLKTLRGIAVGSNDTFYVAGDLAVVHLSKTGERLSAFAVKEPARCVAVGKDGRIYLGMQDHVEVYDPAGKQASAWIGLGENAIITSIAAGSNCVFVADAGGHVVMRFDLSGALLGVIGKKDTARGIEGFIVPSPYFDVALGANDTVWIVNPGKQHVGNYTPEGKLLTGWGKSAMDIDAFCGCCNPSHIAVRSDGRLVTSEKGLPRIKIYDPAGKFIGVVAGFEQFAEDTVGMDVAVDSEGRILVLDPKKGLIRIFVEKKKTSQEQGK
jgi:hypothetical protein